MVRTTLGTDGELGYNYLAQGDDIYLYTGVSSVTADSSNVGFILVNQRTGESHYYPVAGATEDSAQASAEGQVQNLKYEATYPLLLNVAGQPTYFMALKDNAGLVKMYAMINVEHYQSVATGSTVASTHPLLLNVAGQPTYFMALKDNAGLVKMYAMINVEHYQSVATGSTVASTQESYLQMLASSGALSEDEVAANGVEDQLSGTIASIAQACRKRSRGPAVRYHRLDRASGHRRQLAFLRDA